MVWWKNKTRSQILEDKAYNSHLTGEEIAEIDSKNFLLS